MKAREKVRAAMGMERRIDSIGDTRKTLEIELYTTNKDTGEFIFEAIKLPAEEEEIREVIQRLQAIGTKVLVWSSLAECKMFPGLEEFQLEEPTVDELNFFAKRLVAMTDKEKLVFEAMLQGTLSQDYIPIRFITMQILINHTYGLNDIPIAYNVSNFEELGRFAFENDMNSDIIGVPEKVIPYLDFEKIGKIQQENDEGVFIQGCYVALGHFMPLDPYDGYTLPKEGATKAELHTQNPSM